MLMEITELKTYLFQFKETWCREEKDKYIQKILIHSLVILEMSL